MNIVSLIGRITKDLEIKESKNGKKFSFLTLAVTKNTKTKEADFINIIIWEQAVDYLTKYAKKGTMISITGSLTTLPKKDTKLKELIVQSSNVSILSQPKENNLTQEISI